MNIFVLHKDPSISAKLMCDKHIRSKMIVESGQMLAYCFNADTLSQTDCPRSATGSARKHSKRHMHHPCSKWVVESRSNMRWLIEHALEMCRERYRRWPNSKEHFTRQFIEWCLNNIERSTVPEGPLTQFALAITKDSNCRQVPFFNHLTTIEKYNLYYKMDKPFAVWTAPKI